MTDETDVKTTEALDETIGEGRSIFDPDFPMEDLELMISTEDFLPGTSLVGIGEQENFEKLLRYRNNAKMLAQIIIKKRLGQRALAEPISVKEKRLAIREIEAKLKASKQQSATFYQKEILSLLKEMKLMLEIILRQKINGGSK